MKDQIKATIEAHAGELADISRWMYENPEVAYEERESSARLADFLRGSGFDVEYPAYGLETAFVARAGDTGPEVIICAEYDALPGVGHACGHNIIATSALGAGIGLLDVRSPRERVGQQLVEVAGFLRPGDCIEGFS